MLIVCYLRLLFPFLLLEEHHDDARCFIPCRIQTLRTDGSPCYQACALRKGGLLWSNLGPSNNYNSDFTSTFCAGLLNSLLRAQSTIDTVGRIHGYLRHIGLDTYVSYTIRSYKTVLKTVHRVPLRHYISCIYSPRVHLSSTSFAKPSLESTREIPIHQMRSISKR